MLLGYKRVRVLQDQIRGLEEERDSIRDRHHAEMTKLQSEIVEVRGQLADLERQRKHEAEDIAHCLKIKESKLEIDFERKTQAIEAAQARAIEAVKDDYRDKLEKQLALETTRIEKMYAEVLARLPNVNVKLRGGA